MHEYTAIAYELAESVARGAGIGHRESRGAGRRATIKAFNEKREPVFKGR